jgi:hypothetical protein
MLSKHQEHLDARMDHTGDWVLNHPTYEEWKCALGSVLWLIGPSE